MQGKKGTGLRNKLAVCAECGVERKICKVYPPTCYTCYDKLRYKEGRLRSEQEKKRKQEYYQENKERLKKAQIERYWANHERSLERAKVARAKRGIQSRQYQKRSKKVEVEKVDTAPCPVCNDRFETHGLCEWRMKQHVNGG